MKRLNRSNIISFCIGVVVAAAASLLLKPVEKDVQKHVYLDVNRIIKEITTAVVAKNLAQDKAQEEVEVYKKSFDKALIDYSKKHNAIIFSSPKPLSGAKEVTDDFINELIAKTK
jgi:hypothetical protein